ncbi:hypothetical protein CS063_15010 [Sporanaerobium hydrogeniformans]|uniref:Uncharacterized protein n=1 Tax=Sporanaerobium hydrogeniformans TaxID=3072179 RepID=A0AC61DA23_9FIRM|nr:PD-(D/E)XK nuclease-like domain-containing protein [Sporanaerobium hydrogeniformans]PHV69553.1 hypothetical protein CS063_15010 [Sporanaerobium hydrogeniformans]
MELSRKNYFSKEAEAAYMGSSSFKAWDILHTGGCEARELAKHNGEWQDKENDAYLLGSYVHAWNEGTLKEFITEHPEMFKKDGSIYAKFALGDVMINTLKNDELVERFRKGAEKERIFTGKIAGVDFKIQIDILNIERGYFADVKTTRNLSDSYYNEREKRRETFIDKYDYYTQIAIYAEILRQNLEMDTYLEPYLIVVDKQEVPDHAIIDMGTSFIEDKLEEIKGRLPRIMAVRNGVEEPIACGKCDYCRSKKKAEIVTIGQYMQSLGL